MSELNGKAITWKYTQEFNNAVLDGVITREEFLALTPEEQAMLTEGLGGHIKFSNGDEIILKKKDSQETPEQVIPHNQNRPGFFRRIVNKFVDFVADKTGFLSNLSETRKYNDFVKYNYVEMDTSEFPYIAVEKESGQPYNPENAVSEHTLSDKEISQLSPAGQEAISKSRDVIASMFAEAFPDSIDINFIQTDHYIGYRVVSPSKDLPKVSNKDGTKNIDFGSIDGVGKPTSIEFNRVVPQKHISEQKLRQDAYDLIQFYKLPVADVGKLLANRGIDTHFLYSAEFMQSVLGDDWVLDNSEEYINDWKIYSNLGRVASDLMDEMRDRESYDNEQEYEDHSRKVDEAMKEMRNVADNFDNKWKDRSEGKYDFYQLINVFSLIFP